MKQYTKSLGLHYNKHSKMIPFKNRTIIVESFGNIYDISLESALEVRDFKKY
jgi:hypothetical protein